MKPIEDMTDEELREELRVFFHDDRHTNDQWLRRHFVRRELDKRRGFLWNQVNDRLNGKDE